MVAYRQRGKHQRRVNPARLGTWRRTSPLDSLRHQVCHATTAMGQLQTSVREVWPRAPLKYPPKLALFSMLMRPARYR
jgi:hypothetical protein